MPPDPDFHQLWVYLSTQPLTALTLTLVAYVAADAVYRRAGRHPILNPVLWSVVVLVALLHLTDTPYSRYFEGAQFVHFLLGPATVALAIPLYRQIQAVRRSALALVGAILLGSTAAVVAALGVAWLAGASEAVLLSLAPKSVTSAIAMGIAEQIGGIPALTAVLVILTGIIGAMMVTPLLNALGITDWKARGVAAGTTAHGIGTARALQVHEVAGAFAGLAMGLNALFTAILLPLVLRLFT